MAREERRMAQRDDMHGEQSSVFEPVKNNFIFLLIVEKFGINELYRTE
jgi:hypothetical protein